VEGIVTDTAREREIQRILASDPDYARDTDITKRADRVEKMSKLTADDVVKEKDISKDDRRLAKSFIKSARGGGGGGGMMPDLEGLKGRRFKLYKKGGMTASSRADGIAQRGKTRGMMK
jgi:hypothetical protein